MRALFTGAGGPRHAITDVYDEEKHTFLVQYPVWLIVVLSLGGVATFAMTGFLGYSDKSTFHQPWPLFLWFCALLITLQVSILRNVKLRGRLVAMLAVTLVCVIFILITYFSGSLPQFIRDLLDKGRMLRLMATSQWTYLVINFGILIVFWLDNVRRWIRRGRGLAPNARVDLQTGEKVKAAVEDLPSMQELISGDLIAGAVLALVLSVIFQPQVVTLFIHMPAATPIDNCTLALPAHCTPPGGGPYNAPTLTFVDLIQTLVLLPLGLLVLALSATLSGLGAVGGVNDRKLQQEQVITPNTNQPGTVPITVDVTQTLINTVRSAIDRRIRELTTNLALSFRSVAWPGLIFLGTYGVAELSTDVQLYLHNSKTLEHAIQFELPALGWGLVAVLGVIMSTALLVFRRRVAENSLRFLGLIGFIVLLTFWLFSLALWGFNQLILFIQSHTNTSVNLQAQRWHPFDLGASTIISLSALVIAAVIFVFRRVRSPQVSVDANTPPPAVAGAGVNTSPAVSSRIDSATATPPMPPERPGES